LAPNTKKKDGMEEHASLVVVDVIFLLGLTGLMAAKVRSVGGWVESVEGRVEEITR
jgi:hypothetical protein